MHNEPWLQALQSHTHAARAPIMAVDVLCCCACPVGLLALVVVLALAMVISIITHHWPGVQR